MARLKPFARRSITGMIRKHSLVSQILFPLQITHARIKTIFDKKGNIQKKDAFSGYKQYHLFVSESLWL